MEKKKLVYPVVVSHLTGILHVVVSHLTGILQVSDKQNLYSGILVISLLLVHLFTCWTL
jgi:hypothetical protein